MPELPEVETIRRVLEPQLLQASIEEVTVNRPEVIAHPVRVRFLHAACGADHLRHGTPGKILKHSSGRRQPAPCSSADDRLSPADTCIRSRRKTHPSDFPSE